MPDFNLPGRRPADADSAEAQVHLLAAEGSYELLSESTVPDALGGSDNFFLFEGYNEWGMPAVAAHLHHNEDDKTFTLAAEPAPTFAAGAAWLVQHGADPQQFLQHARGAGAPADARSAAAAARIVESGSRYQLVEHGIEYGETWALLRDNAAVSAERPFLLQLESAHHQRGYTLREGSFSSPQEVQQWLESRRTPLPPVVGDEVSVVVSPQASAARARTTGAGQRATAQEPAAVLTGASVVSRRAVR
ncbi:hypothetical protein ACIPLC_15775 [Kitasatospora sp. NPDC086801]|uniref:hypothetical protein n=1 Tax=Kitasatospora sp. NPDC086801 TaxID=3364066 RepID=UPI003824A421